MSTVTPITREPHFLLPSVSTDEELPTGNRWEASLFFAIIASTIISGLAIVGGIDVLHRFVPGL